ncbi:hypothetical protein PENSUB_11155 [Penicillium subrubescens]|uniref:Uncharacterized protein n=1 Tax=Penicillium subrubescens TaxID=1316194 RepID=A0A1Q5T5Y4_9EURO|nr:hypothetical protein PENSUB_11155 [Penicillium subrubescens]
MSTQEASDSTVSFGQIYAILNLDWMPLLINAVAETTEGKLGSTTIFNKMMPFIARAVALLPSSRPSLSTAGN